jgi:hypothetical protein
MIGLEAGEEATVTTHIYKHLHKSYQIRYIKIVPVGPTWLRPFTMCIRHVKRWVELQLMDVVCTGSR